MRSHITRALLCVMILRISEVHSLSLPCDKKVALVAAAGMLSALLIVTIIIIIVIQCKIRQSKYKGSPNLSRQRVRPVVCDATLGSQEHGRHLANDNMVIDQYDSEDPYEYVQPEDWYHSPQQDDARAPDVEFGTFLPRNPAVVCIETINDIYEDLDSFENTSDIY